MRTYVVPLFGLLVACASTPDSPGDGAPEKRLQVVALLQSLETGAPEPAGYINPKKYIQHNLAIADGVEGFGALLAHKPPQGFKAKVIRAFEDGEFVFTHTEYDFFGPKVGFDVFRFEGGLMVEHWDNLTEVAPPNPSGHTQTDGPTKITDRAQTRTNKARVRDFYESVLIGGQMNRIGEFIDAENYRQHNPAIADGLAGLGAAMKAMAEQGVTMKFDKVHKVLGEGNFVLVMAEGAFAAEPTAYYDLFRVEAGKIVEHWDVIEAIPPRSAWKNDNGKF